MSTGLVAASVALGEQLLQQLIRLASRAHAHAAGATN
jgi:hypothetical protein